MVNPIINNFLKLTFPNVWNDDENHHYAYYAAGFGVFMSSLVLLVCSSRCVKWCKRKLAKLAGREADESEIPILTPGPLATRYVPTPPPSRKTPSDESFSLADPPHESMEESYLQRMIKRMNEIRLGLDREKKRQLPELSSSGSMTSRHFPMYDEEFEVLSEMKNFPTTSSQSNLPDTETRDHAETSKTSALTDSGQWARHLAMFKKQSEPITQVGWAMPANVDETGRIIESVAGSPLSDTADEWEAAMSEWVMPDIPGEIVEDSTEECPMSEIVDLIDLTDVAETESAVSETKGVTAATKDSGEDLMFQSDWFNKSVMTEKPEGEAANVPSTSLEDVPQSAKQRKAKKSLRRDS